MAHGLNLAAQLTLIALLGADAFANIGLGLMALGSVCFLGEVGFNAYFLRETAKPGQWLTPWREAAGSRLVVLAGISVFAWLALGWSAPQPDLARMVLVSAALGIVASAINPTPVLFGLGRVRTASAGIVLRFSVQAMGCVATALVWPDAIAFGVGFSFAAGIILQVVVGQMAGLPRLALVPRWPRRLPPVPALRLWGLSLAGTLSDRALPFVIGGVRPSILAAAVILLQILHALNGLISQMDRLVIPEAARGGDVSAVWRTIFPALLSVTVIAVCVLPLLAWRFYPGQQWVALLLAVEWGLVLVATLSFCLSFARHGEKRIAHFILWAGPCSVLAQIWLSAHAELEAVLALRVAVVAITTWLGLQCVRAVTGQSRV